MLVVSAPLAAAARTLPRSQEFASAEPTHRQLRVLRSYERYLARLRVQSVKAGRAVKFAYRQVGKPYQWGGAGPRTYDCSGLVMAAWRKGGLSLPHRADLQHRMIRRKVGLKHLRPGDLVFFSGDHHVGIYVGRHHFLHAPHTGARVQRGTLSGWRLRSFAGAARPGAPTYHAWPHWVRSLADHTDGHGIARPHRPHGHDHAVGPDASLPDASRPDAAPVTDPLSAGLGDDDAEDQAPDTGVAAAQPPVLAPAPPVATMPAPASASAVDRPQAASVVNMSAPSAGGRQHASPVPGTDVRRHHVVTPDTTPVPQPGAAGQGSSRPRPHWPRTSVRQQNDQQEFNRDYDDNNSGGDDVDAGNDGIDLRSLLGVAP